MIYLNYFCCVSFLVYPFEQNGLLQYAKCRRKDGREKKSDRPVRVTIHVAS